MDTMADNDVVPKAAHGRHGGALLALHHRRHAAVGDESADSGQGVLAGTEL